MVFYNVVLVRGKSNSSHYNMTEESTSCRFMTITDVILHFMSNNENALFYYLLSDFIYSDTSASTLTPTLSPDTVCSKQCYNIPWVSVLYIFSGQWLKSKATDWKKVNIGRNSQLKHCILTWIMRFSREYC